ncbi:UNKNOWN [Stylonychia lemnae]|uniref:Uncharacterized protein n=1 Tax=Stylonychia lemnae TaxID=5949 RepID=A0A077ZRF5_STYLE|nr:UNKNOWN [Stylonychia lemnae]|eukprot:CDW71920.1 UNKNOWN [Stylonychia lemnae]
MNQNLTLFSDDDNLFECPLSNVSNQLFEQISNHKFLKYNSSSFDERHREQNKSLNKTQQNQQKPQPINQQNVLIPFLYFQVPVNDAITECLESLGVQRIQNSTTIFLSQNSDQYSMGSQDPLRKFKNNPQTVVVLQSDTCEKMYYEKLNENMHSKQKKNKQFLYNPLDKLDPKHLKPNYQLEREQREIEREIEQNKKQGKKTFIGKQVLEPKQVSQKKPDVQIIGNNESIKLLDKLGIQQIGVNINFQRKDATSKASSKPVNSNSETVHRQNQKRNQPDADDLEILEQNVRQIQNSKANDHFHQRNSRDKIDKTRKQFDNRKKFNDQNEFGISKNLNIQRNSSPSKRTQNRTSKSLLTQNIEKQTPSKSTKKRLLDLPIIENYLNNQIEINIPETNQKKKLKREEQTFTQLEEGEINITSNNLNQIVNTNNSIALPLVNQNNLEQPIYGSNSKDLNKQIQNLNLSDNIAQVSIRQFENSASDNSQTLDLIIDNELADYQMELEVENPEQIQINQHQQIQVELSENQKAKQNFQQFLNELPQKIYSPNKPLKVAQWPATGFPNKIQVDSQQKENYLIKYQQLLKLRNEQIQSSQEYLQRQQDMRSIIHIKNQLEYVITKRLADVKGILQKLVNLARILNIKGKQAEEFLKWIVGKGQKQEKMKIQIYQNISYKLYLLIWVNQKGKYCYDLVPTQGNQCSFDGMSVD